MSQTHKRVQSPAYNPQHDGPRVNRWLRSVKPGDVITAIAGLGAILTALGWRYYSPVTMDARVSTVEKRVDTLSNDLKFTNYLLCVQLRKTDPASLPPGCAPIIDRGPRP